MVIKITSEILAKSGSEGGHGKALMLWAHENLEKYPELKWLTHIPNGGLRDPKSASNLKAQGVKRGVMDYLLLVHRGGYAALWIELKKFGGKTSDEQKDWIWHAQDEGHYALVCEGWECARDTIIWYLELGDYNNAA